MKRILIILLITAFGLNFQASSQQLIRPSNPEQLGKAVIKTFKDENYAEFLSLIFTDLDCEIVAKNADATDSARITGANEMKAFANHTRLNSKENFQGILEQAKIKGINWQKAEITDIKFEIRNRNKIESTDIFLFCKQESLIFMVKLEDCHKSDAWLMMDKVKIKFKG